MEPLEFLGKDALDLGRTEISRVNLDDGLAGPGINTLLVYTGTPPAVNDAISMLEQERNSVRSLRNLDSKNTESLFDELADGVGLTSGEDEVLGSLLLKHHPHALDVVKSYSENQKDILVVSG